RAAGRRAARLGAPALARAGASSRGRRRARGRSGSAPPPERRARSGRAGARAATAAPPGSRAAPPRRAPRRPRMPRGRGPDRAGSSPRTVAGPPHPRRAARMLAWCMLRRSGAAALVAAIALLSSLTPSHAQQAPPNLVGQLREIVQSSGIADKVGVAVVDIDAGRPVFQYHAERPMNPASNQKLVTAFAALRTLGADFRMRTAVYGRIENDAVVGGLALRGYGDPLLSSGDLMVLARDV